jgi:CheY-like chemotaxis protein
LKSNLVTRHVPVHVITTEEDTSRGLALGARGVVTKPIKTKETLDQLFASINGFINRREKQLLLLWPDTQDRAPIQELLEHRGVRTRIVESGPEALGALDELTFDGVILGVLEPPVVSIETLAEISRQCAAREIPQIFCVPRPLDAATEEDLHRLLSLHSGRAREARSLERLLDQAALLLHVPVAELDAEKRHTLESIYSNDRVLAGKKVLIVDDDIRNIYSLTSVLESYDVQVLHAERGREGIEILENSHVDLALIDIMMPEMDGYETMREIRMQPQFQAIPLIAVTAKAMKGDREKTLQAGAWDYLSKPVDTDQMLSVLRNWLFR